MIHDRSFGVDRLGKRLREGRREGEGKKGIVEAELVAWLLMRLDDYEVDHIADSSREALRAQRAVGGLGCCEELLRPALPHHQPSSVMCPLPGDSGRRVRANPFILLDSWRWRLFLTV